MSEFKYDNQFIKASIRSSIDLLDRVFEQYKQQYIRDKVFPIFIMNTGDEVFMSNMTDIGEAKTELYDRLPRMVLSVKDLSIDTDQLTKPGNKTRIGAKVNDELKMGWTSARRIPLSLIIQTKTFFSTLNEYLEFIEYYITIIANYSLSFSFYHNNVLFQGLIKQVFDYENDTNYDLSFDSATRNKSIEMRFEIDIQMPAYNIYPVENLNSNDLGWEPGIIFDENIGAEDNDGSCNGDADSGGMKTLIHNMFVNSKDEQGFVSRTIIPKEDV